MGAQARVLGENDISDEVKDEHEPGQEGGECPKQRKSQSRYAKAVVLRSWTYRNGNGGGQGH